MNIENVEGIGPSFAKALREAGIRSTARLLKVAGDKRGRSKLAAETGISEKLILEWVNHADLTRIKGVGEEYSDLLEEAGVDTVNELKNRNPANLHETILKVNQAKKLVRRPPALSMVTNWINQAKKLEPMVTY
jgi:predicted flap endonuclease-1-like 5' DNA nuclease